MFAPSEFAIKLLVYVCCGKLVLPKAVEEFGFQDGDLAQFGFQDLLNVIEAEAVDFGQGDQIGRLKRRVIVLDEAGDFWPDLAERKKLVARERLFTDRAPGGGRGCSSHCRFAGVDPSKGEDQEC